MNNNQTKLDLTINTPRTEVNNEDAAADDDDDDDGEVLNFDDTSDAIDYSDESTRQQPIYPYTSGHHNNKNNNTHSNQRAEDKSNSNGEKIPNSNKTEPQEQPKYKNKEIPNSNKTEPQEQSKYKNNILNYYFNDTSVNHNENVLPR